MIPLTPIPANIPAELRALPQWCPWKYLPNPKGGKDIKFPVNLGARGGADSTDPNTWVTFDEAMDAYRTGRYTGLFFALTARDPYVFIDLDGCRDPESGAIAAWARRIIERFDSYTEVSVGGAGVHILIKGKMPGDKCRPPGTSIEVYEKERFAALTGHVLGGAA
jgi:primase-polymerase (primpol)-like protein